MAVVGASENVPYVPRNLKDPVLEIPSQMQICLHCHQSTIGGRFCTNCGTRLPHTVPRGVTATLGSGYLRPVATGTLSPKTAPTILKPIGERREVTVLFLDITDFTRSVHQLDDEEAYVLIDEVLQQLVALVAEYEGHVDKFTGDGLMALFGAPVAHENDAELAIRAALAMQKRLSHLVVPIQEKYGIVMQARIGINTGFVIAGKVGGNVHMEYTVIGDTVNLASRLEQSAEPGSVLVSTATYQRARSIFHFRALPPFQVKGKPTPVYAYEPTGIRQKPGRVRGLPGMQAPMVGRQAQLRLLKKQLELVRQHQHSRFVLVTGEAGVGKSRLVTEFRTSLPADMQLYEGSCLAYTRSRPYWVIAELFRQLIGVSENGSSAKQRAALGTYLQKMGESHREKYPFLLHMLGLAHTDAEVTKTITQYDAGMLHQLTQVAIRDIFLAETAVAPTIFIFEDLHWIDDASRLALQFILQTSTDAPALFCFISRDVDTHIHHQLAAAVPPTRQRLISKIHLAPLTSSESHHLVKRLLRVEMPDSDKLLDRIVTIAEGNPFFTEELVRMLIDNGGIIYQENQWEIQPIADQILNDTPGTLHGLIMARFDQLPPESRRLLQKAAVLGYSFPLELLQELSQSKNISGSIQELVARQFLIRDPSSTQTHFLFHHALMQQAIYNTLLRRDRQALHQRAAEAIELQDDYTEEEKSELLAFHYARSAEPTLAVSHLIVAAGATQKRYANETAIAHYRTALTLIEKHNLAHDETYYSAEIGLGQTLITLGHYESAHAILQRVMEEMLQWSLRAEPAEQLPILITGLLELADLGMREGNYWEALGHLNAGIQAIGEKGRQQTPHLWRSLIERFALAYLQLGQLEKAYALALSATSTNNTDAKVHPITLAKLYNTLALISWHQGQVNSATDYIGQSLNIYRNLGYQWNVTDASNSMALLQTHLGQWQEANRNWEEALIFMQQTGDRAREALYQANLGRLRLLMGQRRAAYKHLRAALQIYQALGDKRLEGETLATLAWLACQHENLSEAVSYISRAKKIATEHGSQMTQAQILWIESSIEMANGNLTTAHDLISDAQRIIESEGFIDVSVDCERTIGLINVQMGKWAEAEAPLRRSVELCQRLNDPYRYGLGLMALSQLCAKTSRRQEAVNHLKEAIRHFEKLGAARDLHLATNYLDRLEGAVALLQPPIATTGSLGNGQSSHSKTTVTILWLHIIPPVGQDAESVFEHLSELMPACAGIVDEHGGHVIHQHQFLAIFENVNGNGISAALHLHNQIRSYTNLPFRFKIALTQSDIASNYADSADFILPGKTLQEAQNLLQHIPEQQVWVAKAVYDLNAHLYDFIPVIPTGKRVLPMWQLAEAHMPVFPVVQRVPLPLVGREEVLEDLYNFVANGAINNQGGTIILEGDAGIGKSRLLKATISLIAEQMEGHYLLTTCYAQNRNVPYSLVATGCRQLFSLTDHDPVDVLQKKVTKAFNRLPAELKASQPYIEMILGLPTASDQINDPNTQQTQTETLASLHQLFTHFATEKPLLLLLDDLHWLDELSTQFLTRLTIAMSSLPIFVIGATQSGKRRRLIHQLERLLTTQFRYRTLPPLSDEQTRTLLRHLLSQQYIVESSANEIIQYSQGNPSHLINLTLHLIEQGYLSKVSAQWHPRSNLRKTLSALPASLPELYLKIE